MRTRFDQFAKQMSVVASLEGTVPLPVQWVVSSGRPVSALVGLRFNRRPARGWGPGVYDGPPLAFTRLVVLAELPETRDTLLMRLMGAGRVLERALEELRELPMDAPERALTLPLLVRLRIEIPADAAQRTKEDEEFIMATEDALERYNEQLESKGRRAGLMDVYVARFGDPPPDIAEIIRATTDPKQLGAWTKLAVRGSEEEVSGAIRSTRSEATSTHG